MVLLFLGTTFIFCLALVVAVAITCFVIDELESNRSRIIVSLCGLIAVGLIVYWGFCDIGRVKATPNYKMAVIDQEIRVLEYEREKLENLDRRLSALEASGIDYSTISLEELRERVSALLEQASND